MRPSQKQQLHGASKKRRLHLLLRRNKRSSANALVAGAPPHHIRRKGKKNRSHGEHEKTHDRHRNERKQTLPRKRRQLTSGKDAKSARARSAIQGRRPGLGHRRAIAASVWSGQAGSLRYSGHLQDRPALQRSRAVTNWNVKPTPPQMT